MNRNWGVTDLVVLATFILVLLMSLDVLPK